MMALDDVKQCCLQLDSDRITDRKKGSELLKDLLNNPNIVASLDARPSDVFNWNQVFYSSRNFFLKEARRLEDDERSKPNGSQTVLTNRANLKRAAAALPKLVLKKSSLRTPHVSVGKVVDLVLTVLGRKRSYLLENFSGDFLQVAHKYLLHHPQYYKEILPDSWRELMKICIWLYENESANTDKLIILKVVEGVVRCSRQWESCQHASSTNKTLYPLAKFLKRALTSSSLSSQHGLQSALLSLLLTFTRAMSSEWRHLLCSVGEETFSAVLAMWEPRPSPRQTHWLQYLNLIILMHHPQKGGEACDESEVTEDSLQWRRCLHHLYQLIVDYLDQLAAKGRLGGTSQHTIPSLLVKLTARLCHKIFQETDGYGVLDLTQVSSNQGGTQTNEGNHSSTGSNKRRRIEVGLGPLTTLLRTEGCQLHFLPWYHILYELLTFYAALFDHPRCCLTLDAFTQVLAECRNPSVQEHILRCLRALAVQYKRVCPESGIKNRSEGAKWMSVWDRALSLVGGKQCSGCGLQLLQTLMETGIIHPTLSIYKLFYQGRVDMNEAALSTLLTLITQLPLPKYFKNESALFSKDQMKESRITLLQSLLPVQNEGGVSVLPLEDPTLLAHLLFCLSLHDPTCAFDEFKKVVKPKENSTTDVINDDYLEQLEDLYHYSALVCSLPQLPHKDGEDKRGTGEGRGLMVVQEQQEHVTTRLITFLMQLESEDMFDQAEGLKVGLKLAELLVILLLHLSDQRLQERLGAVLTLVASGFESLSKEPESTRWHSLLPPLLSLRHLYLGAATATNQSQFQNAGAKNWSERVREKLIPLTPPALYTLVVNLARDGLSKTKPITATQPGLRNSFTQGSFSDSMDFDLDMSGGPSMSARDDFQQFEDNDSNSPPDAPSQAEKVSLDDVGTWSQQRQCVWAGLTWLTTACPPAITTPASPSPSITNPDATHLLHAINVVFDLANNPSLEMADIGVILQFVESLFIMEYNEDNIEDGLHMLSVVYSKQINDPQVAASAVNSITALLRANSVQLSSDAKKNVVALIRAFTTKQHSGIYGHSISQVILALSVELCKVDPLGAWQGDRTREEGLCGQIPDLLCSHSHRLRITAATSVHCLLTRSDRADAAYQDQVFQELYQAGLQALNIQGSLPEDLKSDESSGRVSSFLLTLGIVALNSLYLRSRALFALCHAVPEHQVDPILVARLISRVAAGSGLSMMEMMREELPYLATQWVQHKHSIADFPPALLVCPNSASFLTAYRNILLPSLLECDRSPALEFLANLAGSCGWEAKDLFADNFSTIMAHVFPYIAAEHANTPSISKARIQIAKKHYKLVEKELGEEKFSELMHLHVGDVVAGVVRLAHCPEPMVPGELVLTPNPPHFPPTFVHTTLAFIGKMFGEDQPLFATLAKQRSEFQVVLECVAVSLARSRNPPTARQALTALEVVVEAVLPCLAHYARASAPAAIRSLVHTLTTHLPALVTLSPYLADYCIKLLSRVCSFTMENYPDQFIPLAPLIVARLVPLSKHGSEVREKCIKALGDVLSSEHPGVQMALAALPPLPSQGEYESLSELQKTHERLVMECRGILLLREEVETFLALSHDQIHTHCLTHIHNMLQKGQEQVAELYESAGAGQETTAHRLTHRLITLASGNREKVALEACRCLGILGPVSLGSPVFHIQNLEHYMDGSSDAESEATHKVLLELNRYLMDEDMEVVVAASAVLKDVLATSTGYSVLRNLSHATQQQLILLTPLSTPKANTTSVPGLDAAGYEEVLTSSELWLCGGGKYETWVSGLATTLIQAGCGSDVIAQLLPVCRIKPEFSAFVLPLVVHAALRTDSASRRDVLSHQFSTFFHHHAEAVKTDSNDVQEGKEMVTNKAALQVLLNVVDFLRTQTPQESFSGREKITPFERNLWLGLNFLEVAQAAHYCGAHFSALLFLHLRCEGMQSAVLGDIDVEGRQEPPLTQISSHPDAPTLTTLLLQVYSSLGERAGVEGCVGSSRFVGAEARALCCHHRGQWIQAFALKDATSDTLGMVDGLRSLGFFNTLSDLLSKSSLSNSPEVSEAQWEAAWRLSKWNDSSFEGPLVEEETSRRGKNEEEENFHSSLFLALQSLHHQDLPSLHHHILTARKGVTSRLRLNRAESSSSIYPVLSRLQILSEVEAASECLNHINNTEQLNRCISDLAVSWGGQRVGAGVAGVEHQNWEPVVAARVSMLRAVATRCKTRQLDTLLHATLLTKSELSREDRAKGGVGCEWAVAGARLLDPSLPPTATWLTRLEEAHVARRRGDVQLALCSLQPLIDSFKKKKSMEQSHEQVMCQGLTLYGCLLMDSRTRTPQPIIRDYFNRAVTMLEGNKEEGSTGVLEETYHQLASYGDQLYRQLHQHLESDAIQAKRTNIARSKEEIVRLEGLAKNCSDLNEKKELGRKLTILNKNVHIDYKMLSDLGREQEDYLTLALSNYLKCLVVSEKHHLHIYRVVALWLQNLTLPHINHMVAEFGERIKSCQFVPLLYQLVARLSCQRDQHSSFHNALHNLLERMSVEHPHHSLPVVVALAHAHADDHCTSAKTSKQRKKVIEEDRVQAAKALVSQLKKTAIREHVQEFEKVSLAYLHLANWCGTMDNKQHPGQQVKIERNQPLLRLRDLHYTAALTRPLRVQPSTNYDPPLIQNWDNSCSFVGGINAPKRLTVKTSDGLKQFELLKGHDDLRQDAVMEQVFGIVNQLLAQNRETQQRGLSVRTYQVVPLSQRSGLIQWCNNTQAFGEYLIGINKKKGAHKLYHPEDYTSDMCHTKMLRAKILSLEERYDVFQDILEHFHPVFRHFFLEQYPSAHEWQRRRVAYTRSVATTSMVGYILGLGDRHVENILIDRSTAELIHIDLGIAFELGKVLPTPETIPFRMTQDMVDGLGVLGVAGGLRGDCEATLGVLRTCVEVLVTVVEVLRHDPLHHWTLSPQQVARLQATGDDDTIGLVASASMAERVVLRVRQKLAGVEDGFPRTVSEQVATLLQQATDTANLSRVFPGWRPYV